MKFFKASLVFLFLLSQVTLFAQNYKKGVLRLTISTPQIENLFDKSEKSGLKFKEVELETEFKKFKLKKLSKAFPSADSVDSPLLSALRKVYEIECDCDENDLLKELNSKGKKYFSRIEKIGTPILLGSYTPSDYSNYGTDYALDMIKAKEAWGITKGSANIKIAITDVNFDLSHPDLVNKIDYVHANLPHVQSHGTWVAGCAAGDTDNTNGGNPVGKSSIGFNSRLLIYPAWDYDALLHASFTKGAKVINCSWLNSCSPSSYEQEIIDRVYNNGTLIIASASNGNQAQGAESCNIHDYSFPASYNNVISVTSVDRYDNFKFYQVENRVHTHNDKVDISAPGFAVLCINKTGASPAYTEVSGTSFASPIVAGTAALMFAANPSLSPADVERILKETADHTINLKPENAEFANTSGTGRLNAYWAVYKAANCPYTNPTIGVNTVNSQLYYSGMPICNTLSYIIQLGGAEKYSYKILSGSAYVTPTGNAGQYEIIPLKTGVGNLQIKFKGNGVCGIGEVVASFNVQSCSMFSVYPNPAQNSFTVDFEKSPVENPSEIRLFNKGQAEVKRVDLNNPSAQSIFAKSRKVPFEVADLPRGTYFLHVKTEKGLYKQQIVLE